MRLSPIPALLLSAVLPAVPAASAPLAARDLVSPAPGQSGQPNLAVGPDGRVWLSWVEKTPDGGHRLRFASRAPKGDWSAPGTAAEGSGWFVNWADFPSLAVVGDGALAAHWLVKSGSGTYAYDVRVARSADGGRTWGRPVTPHRDGVPAEHGFVSLVPWPDGRVGAVWLDGRETGGEGHGEGHGAAKGAMTLRYATIAADGTLGDEALLDERVCDCCQTSAVRSGDGVIAVYRDRSAEERRDISAVRLQGGRWTEPRPVGNDGWTINGCPVNGPSVDADGARAVTAWFTAPGGKQEVRCAFSTDGGATWGQPVTVQDGRPLGRVDTVLLDGGDALVLWMNQAGEGSEIKLQRVSTRGPVGTPLVVARSTAARASGFPRLVRSGGEVVVAWTDPTGGRVKTAVVTGF